MTEKASSWDATVELDNKISLLLSLISKKYNVRVKTDSDYTKGTIRINIKDNNSSR